MNIKDEKIPDKASELIAIAKQCLREIPNPELAKCAFEAIVSILYQT